MFNLRTKSTLCFIAQGSPNAYKEMEFSVVCFYRGVATMCQVEKGRETYMECNKSVCLE
jgi:hypothetical protein